MCKKERIWTEYHPQGQRPTTQASFPATLSSSTRNYQPIDRLIDPPHQHTHVTHPSSASPPERAGSTPPPTTHIAAPPTAHAARRPPPPPCPSPPPLRVLAVVMAAVGAGAPAAPAPAVAAAAAPHSRFRPPFLGFAAPGSQSVSQSGLVTSLVDRGSTHACPCGLVSIEGLGVGWRWKRRGGCSRRANDGVRHPHTNHTFIQQTAALDNSTNLSDRFRLISKEGSHRQPSGVWYLPSAVLPSPTYR